MMLYYTKSILYLLVYSYIITRLPSGACLEEWRKDRTESAQHLTEEEAHDTPGTYTYSYLACMDV